MNKNNFRGWFDVYRFTFAQTVKKGSFRVVTLLIALGIVLALFGVNAYRAAVKDEVTPTEIENVYVIDESGLLPTDYASIIDAKGDMVFTDVVFHTVTNKAKEELVKEIGKNSSKDVVANITLKDGSYRLEINLPETTELSIGEGEELAEIMVSCFEANKLTQAGISNEQLAMAMSPVILSTAAIGEDTSIAAEILKIGAPMVFGFILYFMLLFHGQTITLEVSTEKTSKLMETLLTTIHPYALITGKVLAVSSVAIMQFGIWIVAILIGLFGGNAIGQMLNPQYSNSIVEIMNFIKDSLGQTAMSIEAIILAIVIFCVGFIFYCVLAGLSGCMVSKPEETATFQSLFQFPIIISFFVCYFGTLAENDSLISIARYIPFTAPFCVPVDLLTGTIGIWEGVISAVILTLFSIVVIMISARIYKGLVLYTGQTLSFKKIVNIIRNSTN